MQRSYKGFLINLEGGEGSGKTSHIPFLVDHFRELGFTVFPAREPGGTSIGEQIREILHSLKNTEMYPRTETLLYQAARAQMVEQVIRPRLVTGEIVLLDRFIDSTYAYQGYGHQQDIGQIQRLIDYATGGLIPDTTVLLDIDPKIGLARKLKSDEWNRLDAFTLEFHQRVRLGYLEIAKADPSRWIIIDASKKQDEVYSSLEREVDNKLRFSGFIERNGHRVER